MSSSIARLLQNDAGLAQRLIERSRERILENHAPEARVRRLLEIYAGLQ